MDNTEWRQNELINGWLVVHSTRIPSVPLFICSYIHSFSTEGPYNFSTCLSVALEPESTGSKPGSLMHYFFDLGKLFSLSMFPFPPVDDGKIQY